MLREPLERVLAQHDVTVDSNYIETGSVHLARAYLQATEAIGVMASAAATDPAQPLAVLPLELPPFFMRPSGVLWNRTRGLTPGALLMISCLEQAAARIAHPGT